MCCRNIRMIDMFLASYKVNGKLLGSSDIFDSIFFFDFFFFLLFFFICLESSTLYHLLSRVLRTFQRIFFLFWDLLGSSRS